MVASGNHSSCWQPHAARNAVVHTLQTFMATSQQHIDPKTRAMHCRLQASRDWYHPMKHKAAALPSKICRVVHRAEQLQAAALHQLCFPLSLAVCLPGALSWHPGLLVSVSAAVGCRSSGRVALRTALAFRHPAGRQRGSRMHQPTTADDHFGPRVQAIRERASGARLPCRRAWHRRRERTGFWWRRWSIEGPVDSHAAVLPMDDQAYHASFWTAQAVHWAAYC